MTVITTCDYCGQPIEDDDDLEVEIRASGWKPGREPGREFVNVYLGHYHSEPPGSGEPSCYERVLDAIWLTHDAGPTFETIDTASSQWVAAQRRKLRPERRNDA